MDNREAFETTLLASGFATAYLQRRAEFPEQYEDDFTQCRWEGWNLAAAHTAAECARICAAQASEWDSDRVVTNKNYAGACEHLIRSKYGVKV